MHFQRWTSGFRALRVRLFPDNVELIAGCVSLGWKAADGFLKRRDARFAGRELQVCLIGRLHAVDVAKQRGRIKSGARHSQGGGCVGLKIRFALLQQRRNRQGAIALEN